MGSGRTLASHPSHARARDPDQPAGQVEEETAFSSSHQVGGRGPGAFIGCPRVNIFIFVINDSPSLENCNTCAYLK